MVEIENKRRMAAGLPVSRSSSRVSRATAAQSAPPPSSRLIRQQQGVDPYDSQYSSSTAPNPAATGAGRVIRWVAGF